MELVERTSAKVLLVDGDGRTLLFRGFDPHHPEAGQWWFAVGGGVEEGEPLEEAARRETYEETGVEIGELGRVVLTRRAEFAFEGTHYDQLEHFFVVRVPWFVPDTTRWNDYERRSILEHRWWTREELRATAETIFPEGLADLLDRCVTE